MDVGVIIGRTQELVFCDHVPFSLTISERKLP